MIEDMYIRNSRRWKATEEPQKERITTKSPREGSQARRTGEKGRGWRGGGDGEEVGGSRSSKYREQEENNRELSGRSCKRRRTAGAAYDQNIGSREAEGVVEGAGGLRRGRSKSASP